MRRTAEPTSLGEAILTARESKGWSRSVLARKLGTEESNVRNWEKGKNRPSLKSYEKICRLFGWPLPYSVDRVGPGLLNSPKDVPRPVGRTWAVIRAA